jgi:hypothetical protein
MLISAQRERRESTAPLAVIPFPSSPCCVLWDEYDKLWFLRPEGTREGWVDAQPTTQENRLQAVAISPDEKYVVFITSFLSFTSITPNSKLCVKSLSIENERFRVGNTISSRTLNKPLSHSKESAVLVQAVDGMPLTVIIAHKNGTYEEISI